MTRAMARPHELAQQEYQLAGLTVSVPKPITGGHFILKTDHAAWEWPRQLNELASILNKLLDSLRLDLQLPDVGRWDRSEAREWTSDLVRQAAPPLPRFPATRIAPPTPPVHAWSRRHPLGVVGEPAAGRIPSVPPWVAGAGSGRVPGPEFAAETAVGTACRISGSLGGSEIR
jgi:hypothetical protein